MVPAFHSRMSLGGRSFSPPSSSTSGAASAAAEEEDEAEPGEERARLRGGMIVSEEEGRWVRAAAVCGDGCRWGGALSRRALGGQAADICTEQIPLLLVADT